MTAAFLGLEAALYAAFMALDLTGGSGGPVKYASIAVCLVFSVLFARRGGSRLMAAAMALTLGADTFLLLLNDWYGAGVALFCGVQALYLVRICRQNGGRSLWGLRLFLITAAWAGLWALGLLSPLNLLAAVYFANFLVNACQALSLSMPLFAWGLCLFLLCDVYVAVLPAGPGAAGAVRPEEGGYFMRKLLSVFAAFAMALTILTGSIALPLVIRPFYRAQIEPLGIPARSGLTVEQIGAAFDDVMDYCLGKRLDFAAGVLSFSPEGASHFADVRRLFLLDLRVLAVCMAVLLVLYALRRKKGLTLCPLAGHSPGFWAGYGLGGALAIAGALAALDFDRAFTVFHSIFFPGKDNWLFDPATDPVILILPEAFFRSCAILILAAVLLCCAALIIADLCRRRRAP